MKRPRESSNEEEVKFSNDVWTKILSFCDSKTIILMKSVSKNMDLLTQNRDIYSIGTYIDGAMQYDLEAQLRYLKVRKTDYHKVVSHMDTLKTFYSKEYIQALLNYGLYKKYNNQLEGGNVRLKCERVSIDHPCWMGDIKLIETRVYINDINSIYVKYDRDVRNYDICVSVMVNGSTTVGHHVFYWMEGLDDYSFNISDGQVLKNVRLPITISKTKLFEFIMNVATCFSYNVNFDSNSKLLVPSTYRMAFDKASTLLWGDPPE